jgi:hypothetical protein
MIKRSVAVLGAVCLGSALLFGQGLSTNASRNDWEEINFEFNSSILSDGYPSLLRLAELLSKNRDYRVRVVGHTDYVGSVQYNEKLALARGNTVRDFLTKYGAAANQVSVSGQGEQDPAVPNTTKEGRFINRRVVLTVTDAQGKVISDGGVGEAINNLDALMKKQEECCSQILKRLDKLDEILAALRDLKGENDRLKTDLSDLRSQHNALRDQISGLPKPLTTEQTTQIARDENQRALDEAARRNQKFSLLGLNIGPTFGGGRTGDWTFSGKGRFFSPFGTGRPPGALGTHAVQIEGEYMYYGGGRQLGPRLAGLRPFGDIPSEFLIGQEWGSRQEGQFDIGLVNRWNRFQMGLFSSFKYVNFTNFQSGGLLGQATATMDYIFSRGRFGAFGTQAFKDNAVLNSVNLGPNSFLETYLRVVNQYGLSAQVGAWGDAYLEGNLAYLRSRGPAPDRPGGMLRLVAPVHQNFAITAEVGLNETLVSSQNMGRLVFGFQFGNWMRPKSYMESQNPVPVDIPRLRYELATRRVGNSAPIADAGPDQIGVSPGAVRLDGSNSRDPDGDPITYQWQQIGGPSVSLSGMNTVQASFTAAEGQSYIFRLTVRDPGGLSDTARVMVTTSTAEAPRILRFVAQPNLIRSGQSSTLIWQTENAETVEITGIGRVASSGTSVVSPAATTMYRLTARNRVGEVNETVTVTVETQTPRFLRCQAIPTNILPGEAATITWETENAQQVNISGIGAVAASGSTTVTPAASTTYTLTARGVSGEVNCTVAVTVASAGVPRVIAFNANPTQIEPGGSAQLCYTVENATEIQINPPVQGLDPSRNSACLTVSPTATTTYVLTARNATGSSSASATVTVGGVRIIEFRNTPDFSTRAGDPVTLTWRTSGATSVTITGLNLTGGSLPASGTLVVNPITNTTYTLIAYGPNGSVSAVLYVFVR